MTLLIAMPGPPLPDRDSAAAGAASDVARDPLPELPQLTRLLSAARRLPSAPDWRSGVLAAFNDGAAPDWSPAAMAARSLPDLPDGQPLCLAAPLHLTAGISRVHLSAHGLLHLEPAEREAWRTAFNGEFGVAGAQLHAVPGGWLLASSAAQAAREQAPEALLGEALARSAAVDDAQRQLRRLGTEVEMWLATHPLNAQREARRLPPVNCFWFWGGARAVTLPPLASPPRTIRGPAQPDAWLAGFARHAGLGQVETADGWSDVRALSEGLVVPAVEEAAAARARWEELEARWFDPMARALRAGSLPPLRLQIGATAWQLPDASPLRWLRGLRSRRSWWQALRP